VPGPPTAQALPDDVLGYYCLDLGLPLAGDCALPLEPAGGGTPPFGVLEIKPTDRNARVAIAGNVGGELLSCFQKRKADKSRLGCNGSGDCGEVRRGLWDSPVLAKIFSEGCLGGLRVFRDFEISREGGRVFDHRSRIFPNSRARALPRLFFGFYTV
jgi:hypothetical protein